MNKFKTCQNCEKVKPKEMFETQVSDNSNLISKACEKCDSELNEKAFEPDLQRTKYLSKEEYIFLKKESEVLPTDDATLKVKSKKKGMTKRKYQHTVYKNDVMNERIKLQKEFDACITYGASINIFKTNSLIEICVFIKFISF